jgi:hypothetical protein
MNTEAFSMPLRDELPPHLAPLVTSEWAIWRWFVLRGAGFPANLVLRLSMSCGAAAADALVSAESAVEDQFQTAIRNLNQWLDHFTREGKKREDPDFKAVLNARRRLADRKIPQETGLLAEFSATFQEIAQSIKQREHLRAEFETAFSECLEHQSGVLRNFASVPRFQEAIIWQNWRAFETGIQSLAGVPGKSVRNQRQRQHEELLANYVQRYCVKNDTIGFFGPVGWGRIESGDDVFMAVPGSSLVSHRHTYFEHWTIEKLATSLSSIEGMDWWIPPRLDPSLSMREGKLHRLGAEPVPLTRLEAAVLALCDGKNLPCELLASVQRESEFRTVGRAELHDLLRKQSFAGILCWRFAVPVEVNSEIAFRQQLLRIGDEQLRDKAITSLDRLEAARQAVAGSVGKPAQLCQAMKCLESVFEEITSVPGKRNPGTTYGGRTLAYEDCRRDLTFTITPELLAPIVPALSLLFRALRWLMQSMTIDFYSLFRQTYEELLAANGERDMPVLTWWAYTEPKLIEAISRSRLEQEFRQKWFEIFPLSQHGQCIQFESQALKDKVEKSFPELGAGFYPVRYFCPDMMLAATGIEAIRRGDLLYVLGEVHAARNSLIHAAFVEQHPNHQDLVDATKWDLSSLHLKLIEPQEDGMTIVRVTEGLFRPGDYHLATTHNATPPTGLTAHPFSELLIQEENGELIVISQANSRRFRIMEAFADLFFALVMSRTFFTLPGTHVPRVLLDKLVIQRETWRVRADELAFALEKDEARRFLGARRWMKRRAVPQRMFVKAVVEKKPFYLDLASPILVEILCRTIRRQLDAGKPAEELIFSEMLPDIEHTWLQDASGAKYTSELRFAAVDLKARAYSQQSL